METEIVACVRAEAASSGSSQASEIQSHTALKNKQSQLLHKRKQLIPFLAPSTPYQLTNTYAKRVAKPNFPQKIDAVTQRVLSGKDHRIKQLQNDFHVARNKINELAVENRLLKSLNKRSDAALSRFQDVEAELPQLLSLHNSEIHMLRERFQKLSIDHREQSRELRNKDMLLQTTREQLGGLQKLLEEKGLKERHEIAQKLEEARESLIELEEQNKNLCRQLILEKKCHKHQMIREQKRYKDLYEELQTSKRNVARLEEKLKSKEKFINDHLTRKEFHQSGRTLSSAFKSISVGSIRKQVRTSNSVSNVSTARSKDALAIRDQDDTESGSFSRNMTPSIDSIIQQLNYSSNDSDGDDDISQIYHNRPTSVPHVTMKTAVSAPWAVDSRTFSIRSNQNHTASNKLATADVSSDPSSSAFSVVGKAEKLSKQDIGDSNKHVHLCIDEGTSETEGVDDETNHADYLTTVKDEIKRDSLQSDEKSVNRSESMVQASEDIEESTSEASNFNKEALLAALKVIDGQQNTQSVLLSSHETLIRNQVENKSNLLQHDLFSAENVNGQQQVIEEKS